MAIIVAVAIIRWLPHPDNFAPIGALALFAGAYLDRRIFWLVPLAAMLIGDLANGLYHLTVLAFVYLGFLASTWLGRQIMYQRVNPIRVSIGVCAGAISFWMISNLGAYLAFRPLTIDALIACYIDAVPYLLRSLTGDAVYAAVLFGGYTLLSRTLNLKAA